MVKARIFDPQDNAQAALYSALANAQSSGKRILIEVGGDWCIWSWRMNSLLSKRKFQQLLRQHFIVIRAFVSKDGRTNLPELAEFPHFDAIPHFFLIGADGRIIGSQGTSGFEFLWMYRPGKVYAFLESWVGGS